jgi:NAD(P)-dependent dehydrogenase (short-subunit alcohol dehydrogenase family)
VVGDRSDQWSDVVVNNAGRTQVGALEETDDSDIRHLFELYFFGPVAITRAALPHMRQQGGGTIVQMSSLGGQVAAPGSAAYCASKFAIEGVTEALSQEVDFGVRFLIVEPGAFRTGLLGEGAALVAPESPTMPPPSVRHDGLCRRVMDANRAIPRRPHVPSSPQSTHRIRRCDYRSGRTLPAGGVGGPSMGEFDP